MSIDVAESRFYCAVCGITAERCHHKTLFKADPLPDTSGIARELYGLAKAEDENAKLRTELAAERERADALGRALCVYGRHLDDCGDHDDYNHADIATCGCGLDAAIDAARGKE
jgi:thiaminase